MLPLTTLINAQEEHAQELLEVLTHEKKAITLRNSKDIESIAAHKSDLIEKLQQTDINISKHPEVKSLKEQPDLMSKVAQIRLDVQECHAMNQINGDALIRAQLSYNKLKNFMQQSQNKVGMTYSAKGQTQTIATLGTNLSV